MALGLKYFARYRDIDGFVKEIRFHKVDYAGPVEEWFCTNGAVTYEYAGFDGMFEQPIIPSQARINLFLSQYYNLKEFVFNRRTFFVEIENTSISKIVWSGWVEPWDAQRPHKKAPWTVSVTASCGLAHLAKKKYINSTNIFKKTGLAIIQECLATIDEDQSLRVSTHMVETSFGGSALMGLTSFEINTSRYYDTNGEAMYCDEIVNDILNHFNAEIMQWDNRWIIRAVVDNATGLETTYTDINSVVDPSAWPLTYLVNGDNAPTLDGGTVRILAPINKYRTEIDFGTQVPFFENGNMVLWTEDGLVGWDFTHMTKGNPGRERFEIGGEVSRGVLRINGKSPKPYSKKKKKKFLQILIPILTGAVGANLKNKYENIEPVQYIESTGGTISKGDKSVTISFDYETEAFSSDILISIRIPVTQPSGKIVNFWVDPSTHPALAGADKTTAGATENFYAIRIPPVDMGTLTDKGTINVSGNPNYPVANYSPGAKQINWTWTVTGVPAGETRKIGGVNGVLVENGDLIIARIPNLGGTQAAVGGSWEVINVRNNTKKGTFSLTIALNTLIIIKAGDEWPADKIYVRFYKMADDSGLPGDWYNIYNLNGALEGFVAKEDSAKYATTLERGDVTDEEAKTITLITGDYNPWYAGAWTKPGSIENTRSWKRRSFLDESMSIYRAMMKDRLCLTTRPLRVVEGTIFTSTNGDLTYLHTLIMQDMFDMRMRITRFSFNDYSKQVKFTAVEVIYEEIPDEELKQNAYIPGTRQLNTVPGKGDGIYPSKQDSTNGRLNAEDMPLTDEELNQVLEEGARLVPLFDKFPPLIFVAGEFSSDSVNMANYLSEVAEYNNEDQEEEDQFDFNTLKWTTYEKPTWVSSQSVVNLNVTVEGKPVYIGDYFITFRVAERPVEMTQEEEEEAAEEAEENGTADIPIAEFYIEVTIPIKVYPKTILTYELLETSGDEPVVIGTLPGIYPLPAKWDIREKIKGDHDAWQMTIFGGGATGNDEPRTVNAEVPETDLGIYRMFEESNGIVTTAGQYRHFTTTSISDVIISRTNMVFTLYDDEFLANGRFFLRKGGVDIGEISLDGTSIFENPEGCNVVFVSSGVEHDGVKLYLSTKAEEPLHDISYLLTDPETVEEGEYNLYESDTVLPNGKYIILAEMSLDGTELIQRFSDFELAKKKPEAEGGSLTLMEKIPGTLNFKAIAVLPKSGSEHELITPGFSVKATGESPEFDWEGWVYQIIRGGVLVTIDISKYTGQPQFIAYPNPVTESGMLVFGVKNSLDIDSIHEEDTTHRVIITRRLGGASGEIAAILQADFSFGTFQDPDEVPDEDEVTDIVDYVGRKAISEETIDYIKYFDVNVDDDTIEIFSPEDPEINWLRVKDLGITFAKLQLIPGKTLIGNLLTGEGAPYAVEVIDLMEEATDENIPSSIVVKDYIDDKLEEALTGTVGNIPKFGTIHTLTASIMNEAAGNITVSGDLIVQDQIQSLIATGTAPLIVASQTKVINLNADLLEGEHGPYYLDWDNFTNYKVITAGVGLTGGGMLDDDRIIAMGVPSTLTSATSNAVSGTTHTHAINTGNLVEGTGISMSGDLTKRLVDLGDITISVDDVPWSAITGTPTTLGGYSITNAYTKTETDSFLAGKENSFSKSSLVAGDNVDLIGTITSRIFGAGNLIISVPSMPWVDITSTPTLISSYGITNAYTKSEIDGMLAGLGTGNVVGSGLGGYVAYWKIDGTLSNTTFQFNSGDLDLQTGSIFGQDATFNNNMIIGRRLEVNSTSASSRPFPKMTITQMLALAGMQEGDVVIGTGSSGGVARCIAYMWCRIPGATTNPSWQPLAFMTEV